MPAPVSVDVITGKSTLIKLPGPITLRTLGDKDIVQARLLSPQTLYILGGNIGSTNMILQDSGGPLHARGHLGRHGPGAGARPSSRS